MNINVYEETGYQNPEEMFLKAKIVFRVSEIIRSKKLTQAQVAELAGITQPQVSNILRGRFRDVSVEKLLRIATALNYDVRIAFDASTGDLPGALIVDGAPAAAR